MPEKQHLTFIKLGGSAITDKNAEKSADLDRIAQFAEEIHEARKSTDDLIVVGHGAGSFGHPQAKKYRTADGFFDQTSAVGLAEVRQAVTQLNALVVAELIKVGEPAVTLSPFSFLTARNKKLGQIFLDSAELMLQNNLLPIIHGDVIMDEGIGCTIFSGETILNILAGELRKKSFSPKMVIEVGKSEGVYDKNGQTIPLINRENFAEIEKELGASHGADVTGGMAHKVAEALELAQLGIPSLLISADAGNLKKAILGEDVKGTWIK